jgi:hypothetical protein
MDSKFVSHGKDGVVIERRFTVDLFKDGMRRMTISNPPEELWSADGGKTWDVSPAKAHRSAVIFAKS